MATFAKSAPVPELKDDHTTRAAEKALHLILNILEEIPETYKSCITHPDTFNLNSTENGNLEVMAVTIGIPTPPVLKALTQDFTLETSLKRMSEGLQLHQALLNEVVPRLNRNERMDGLLSDIRDLLTQIHTMVKPHVQPTLKLSLPDPGGYEVQVATHLTLVQLRSFGCDMVRILRNITADEDMEC